LLKRYEAVYPWTVTEEKPTRGPAGIGIRAPKRTPRKTVAGDSFGGDHSGAAGGDPEYESSRGGAPEPPPEAGDNSEATVSEACQHSLTSTAGGVSTCLKCGEEVAP
jgi:hypothetical protein